MKREDGRSYFYQWELNQRLIVTEECTLVQFGNGTMTNALGCEVKEEDGVRYAEVPNILLQTAADLHAYAWDEKTTSVVGYSIFSVVAMPKPAQYAYTQTEVKQYNTLLETLEKNVAFYMPTVDAEGNLTWQKSLDQLPDIPSVNIMGPQGVQGPQGPQGEPGEVNIDDAAVGDSAWSSKNIIDRLCPAFTESGSVVTCVPVEGYPLEAVTTLPESEEGISAVTLWRGSTNLFPPIDDLDGLAVNGITFRVEGGKIILNGTATAAVNTGVKTKVWLPAGTYTVSGNPYPGSDVRLWLRIYGTTTQKSSYNGKSATVTLEEAAYVYLYITINSDAAVVLDDLVISPMVNAGDTALPWEAYRGESFAADFGITVHGGSYDWTSGVLTDKNGNVTQLEGRKIPALSGTNTLYSDTGDTHVTGRKDPMLVIENQEERISALEASVTALLEG